MDTSTNDNMSSSESAEISSRPHPKPLAGSLTAGLIASLCCGGTMVFGLVGLAALYRALKLWRYVPEFLAVGGLVVVGINWLYYRHRARVGCGTSACRDLRRAMFISTLISLTAMGGSFIFITWLNHAVVNAERFMKMARYAQALIPGVPNAELFYAVASFIGGVALLAVLPFPSPKRQGKG